MNRIYGKLALTNIKNNKQFYLPYLLTGIMSVVMYYTIEAMVNNEGIHSLRGADYIGTFLVLGRAVISLFIIIFLFYTNSFIMKRRKKELGVYNILGMEKKHIAKVLTIESMVTAGISIVGGLAVGIVFNKLLMMLLYSLIRIDSPIQFTISAKGIVSAVILFAIIYGITLIYNLLQVKLANPIELLRSQNVGEKEPKTKIVMTILGLVCVGAGYYISITTESPLEAITMFFEAVILVIIGTYFLFTAGSIAFLKLLRRNKNYYYKTTHFTAVSGMLYRMKQNAVGLANICILSTMVLVMLSTSVSMFVGVEDELLTRYPADISISANIAADVDCSEVLEVAKETIKEQGNVITEVEEIFSLGVTVLLENDAFTGGDNNQMMTNVNWSDLYTLTFCDRQNGQAVCDREFSELKEDEVYLVGYPAYEGETVSFFGEEFKVAEFIERKEKDEAHMITAVGGDYYVILSDKTMLDTIYRKQKESYGDNASDYRYSAHINLEGTPEEKRKCSSLIYERIGAAIAEENSAMHGNVLNYYVESREGNRDDFYAMNGGLLFLGLFLGAMFLMITCLIIYFKQISEGYEDKERFVIMQKVGMSKREVKKTITTQIRLVFILPIFIAAVHVAAAYPIIVRLLALLNLTNVSLFAVCLVGTILVFGIIYFVMFKLTSRSYYRIVGNGK